MTGEPCLLEAPEGAESKRSSEDDLRALGGGSASMEQDVRLRYFANVLVLWMQIKTKKVLRIRARVPTSGYSRGSPFIGGENKHY